MHHAGAPATRLSMSTSANIVAGFAHQIGYWAAHMAEADPSNRRHSNSPFRSEQCRKIGCSPVAACRLTASNEDLFGVTYADGEGYCLAY